MRLRSGRRDFLDGNRSVGPRIVAMRRNFSGQWGRSRLNEWGRTQSKSSEGNLPIMRHNGSLTTNRWTHSAGLRLTCSSVAIAEWLGGYSDSR
jgi:hypothetical protein